MPLRVKCPAGHALIVPDDRAGRTLRCPRCGESVVVPGGREGAAPAEPRVQGSGFRVQSSEVAVEKAVATLFEARFPEQVVERPPPEPVVKPKSRVIAKAIPPRPPAVEVAADSEPASSEAPVSPVAGQRDGVGSQLPQPIFQDKELQPQLTPDPLGAAVVKEAVGGAARAAVEARVTEPVIAAPTDQGEGVGSELRQPVIEDGGQQPQLTPDPAGVAVEQEVAIAPAVDPAPPPLVEVQPTVSAALHADASRTLAVYQLAAAVALVALFSVAPAVWDVIEYLQTDELDTPFVARWALVLFFLGVVQLAYAVYLFQLPDWTSVWVVTLWLLVLAFGYAGVLGLVLISQADGFLVGPHGLQLADKLAGGQAALWCLCMVSIATILAFFAGRMSVQWRRAERMLRVAGY